MKKNYTLIFLLVFFCNFLFAADPATHNKQLVEQPLLFTENKGQVADMNGNLQPDILFTTHSNGVNLFLNKNGISYQFQKTEYPEGYDATDKDKNRTAELEKQIKTSTYRMDMELVGANTNPVIKTDGKSEYFENFYLGHCPNGVLNVPTFTKITYKEVYPKIDWVIYTKDNEMKYDFIVHPGGSPALIKMRYKDAEAIKITTDGRLLATTRLGQVIDHKPMSWQNGSPIESYFELNDAKVTYRIAEYDTAAELVIDPGLVWATYYGGVGDDYGNAVTADGSGNVYMGGYTTSTSGIAIGGFQNIYTGSLQNAMLVKFNSSGSRLWSTYYFGSYTKIYGLNADVNGNIYTVGETLSSTSGFASSGFQSAIGGGFDAFLVKFNSAGSRLWSTYYGGTAYDFGRRVTTDATGNVYIVGNTKSTSAIASGGFQNSLNGTSDAFMVKFSSSGSRLWATYFGGNSDESGEGIAIDNIGNLYIVGETSSNSNIASSGFQSTYAGNTDAYLAKFNASGALVWSTYFGGGSDDHARSVATDINGNIYFTGMTFSTSGIASGGFQNTYNGSYLAKFNGAGNRLWATYYGAFPSDVATDPSGNVYLAGITTSTTGIASGGYQNTFAGVSDAYLAKFDANGARIGATYFGGSAREGEYNYIASVCSDINGNIYLCGVTESTTGIAYNGYQNSNGGGTYEAFLAKFNGCAFFGPDISPTTLTVCVGQNTTLSTSGGTTYQWSTGATTASVTVTPNQTTTYTVTITSSSGCVATASRTVNTYSNTTANITADGMATSIDTITSGDLVQLQLTGSLSATPNIQWSPATNISSASIANPFVYPNTTTTYTVTFSNTNGCTQSQSITIYVKPYSNIGAVSITSPNGNISLFDTLVVNVQLTNVTGLYGLYMKLKGDVAVSTYLTYAGYTVGTLLGTGGSIISTPPVVTSGVYDFGITKIGAVQGYTGSGVFYTFKFVTKNVTIPNNTNFCFYLDNISAYNTSGVQGGLTNQGPYCYTFTDRVNVWPGDLNNSKTVTTADLLPIGYFYNSTGPARPNASLQWIAQPATLWGYGQATTNGSAYKVFADSNGDGIISNADQTAIGFNIGKIHAMLFDNSIHYERAQADGDIVVTATPSSVNNTQLPQTVTFQINLNNNGGLSALYGISFNLLFDNTVFDLTTATIDYTGSIFGASGTDYLVIPFVTDSSISVGLTRYANAAINGQGLLCKITMQTKASIPGSISQTQVRTFVDAANNQAGDPLTVQDAPLNINIGSTNGIISASADLIAIYPNPANEIVYLSSSIGVKEMNGLHVAVFNYLGQKVFESKITEPMQAISTQTWGSSGLYSVEIRKKDGSVLASKKIFVERP